MWLGPEGCKVCTPEGRLRGWHPRQRAQLSRRHGSWNSRTNQKYKVLPAGEGRERAGRLVEGPASLWRVWKTGPSTEDFPLPATRRHEGLTNSQNVFIV